MYFCVIDVCSRLYSNEPAGVFARPAGGGLHMYWSPLAPLFCAGATDRLNFADKLPTPSLFARLYIYMPGNCEKGPIGEPRLGLGAAPPEAGRGAAGRRDPADQAAVRAADGGAGGADARPDVLPPGAGGGESSRVESLVGKLAFCVLLSNVAVGGSALPHRHSSVALSILC